MNFPNYRDFYQIALIPIGFKDRSVLTDMKIHHSALPEISTHWLIAIEGVLLTEPKKYYHWKVSIYPSNSEGAFIWDHVIFSSPAMTSMDGAIELAKTFMTYSQNDELHSANLQEKIS